jgi:ABC-2 type transport system permease protein
MSTIEISSTTPVKEARLHNAKPSFFGLVSGELFKIRRQWSTWIMLAVMVGLIFLPFLISLAESRVATDLSLEPGNFVATWIGYNLLLVRVVSGFILLIITARVIGQEYNLGTIRIVLGRGVGRVQLLLAKLTSVVIWALIILIIGLALNALLTVSLLQIKVGNLDAFNHLDSSLWHDVGIYIGTIGISMGATILVATAFSVLGRSLAFGLSFALIWFPLDNILTGVMAVVYRLTNNDFWQNITAYFLGPNLNVMINVITQREWSFGASPLVPVDSTHTLVVTIVYALIFAVTAFVLTWKRDVKE